MSDCKVCNLMVMPYLIFLGLVSYFVTPYVLLVLLGGYSCKGSCTPDEVDSETPKDKIDLSKD
jgi:hypothetical protein